MTVSHVWKKIVYISYFSWLDWITIMVRFGIFPILFVIEFSFFEMREKSERRQLTEKNLSILLLYSLTHCEQRAKSIFFSDSLLASFFCFATWCSENWSFELHINAHKICHKKRFLETLASSTRVPSSTRFGISKHKTTIGVMIHNRSYCHKNVSHDNAIFFLETI